MVGGVLLRGNDRRSTEAKEETGERGKRKSRSRSEKGGGGGLGEQEGSVFGGVLISGNDRRSTRER